MGGCVSLSRSGKADNKNNNHQHDPHTAPVASSTPIPFESQPTKILPRVDHGAEQQSTLHLSSTSSSSTSSSSSSSSSSSPPARSFPQTSSAVSSGASSHIDMGEESSPQTPKRGKSVLGELLSATQRRMSSLSDSSSASRMALSTTSAEGDKKQRLGLSQDSEGRGSGDADKTAPSVRRSPRAATVALSSSPRDKETVIDLDHQPGVRHQSFLDTAFGPLKELECDAVAVRYEGNFRGKVVLVHGYRVPPDTVLEKKASELRKEASRAGGGSPSSSPPHPTSDQLSRSAGSNSSPTSTPTSPLSATSSSSSSSNHHNGNDNGNNKNDHHNASGDRMSHRDSSAVSRGRTASLAWSQEGSGLEDEDLTLLFKRRQLLVNLDHPNVVKFYDLFFTTDSVYWEVTASYRGPTLQVFLQRHGALPEERCRPIAQQLFSAVAYLHSAGVAHRNLSLASIAIEDPYETPKICDLSYCKSFVQTKLQTSCGSPLFVAPEILISDDYNHAVDLWSLGVILYVMLSGVPPFYEETIPRLFKKIFAARYHFNQPIWEQRSQQCQDLITHLLVADPALRWSAAQSLLAPWFTDQPPSPALPPLSSQ